MQFEFKNGNKDTAWPFYENEIDNIYDLRKLERKAKNWQMILSKMTCMQNKKLIKEKRELQLAD